MRVVGVVIGVCLIEVVLGIMDWLWGYIEVVIWGGLCIWFILVFYCVVFDCIRVGF